MVCLHSHFFFLYLSLANGYGSYRLGVLGFIDCSKMCLIQQVLYVIDGFTDLGTSIGLNSRSVHQWQMISFFITVGVGSEFFAQSLKL